MFQSNVFTALNDPNEETIRKSIGVYLNYFTKPSNDENVVFSVPYNDTGGLGMLNLTLLSRVDLFTVLTGH